jgi:hypothetical protein
MQSPSAATERTRIPDAIFLASASCASYVVAYAYRSGFGSFYGLPPLLLTPTIGGILQAAAAVGAALLSIWLIVNGVWTFVPPGHTALRRAFQRLLLILLISYLAMYSLLSSKWGWVSIVAVLCFFSFFEFVFPLLTQHRTKGYEGKLAAQEKVEAGVNTLSDYIGQRFGNKAILLAITAFILMNFAHSVGYRVAEEQEDFFVLGDAPDHIVAAMDDQMIILVGYDPVRKTLIQHYQVRLFTSKPVWLLEKRHIGKLTGPPKATQSPFEDSCPKCI